jgi:hypothetical protein
MKAKGITPAGASHAFRHSCARVGVAAFLAALSLAASASPAAASVTIGQLAPGSPPPGFADPSGSLDIAQPTVSSGNTYVVPGNGTITSWSHNAAAPAGQELVFKVFRPVTGLTYMVVGHDGPRTLTGGALNAFPSSIPVKPGDVIGLFFNVAPPEKAYFFTAPGAAYVFRNGNLADGESGGFTSSESGYRVNVSAVFVPSNAFSLGAITRNKKKGTATLTTTVPNPGELTGSGKGVKVASAAGAVTSKTVSAPGAVTLTIKAKGKKKRKLNETGKVKVKPTITYTPAGGDPSAQSIKVKLKKKL